MRSILEWQREGQRAAGADLLDAMEGSARAVGRIVGLVAQYALLAVVLAVWCVVGFVFWIPLMARATAAFCATAVYANLVSHGTTVPNRGLRRAVYFYVNGFRSIDRAIVELEAGEPEGTPVFQLKRFFAESLWTVVFWWMALVTLAYLGVAFTQYVDQFVYPITWVFQEASATLAWINYELDVLFGVLQP